MCVHQNMSTNKKIKKKKKKDLYYLFHVYMCGNDNLNAKQEVEMKRKWI